MYFIGVVFCRTRAGSEVVRDWVRDLNEKDRNAIGQDLNCSQGDRIVLLHGLIEKTPDADLALAGKRKRE